MQAPPGDVSALTRAAIALDAPATRTAAMAITAAGGNAVDITVAAALAATLSEALMCSLVGSGFRWARGQALSGCQGDAWHHWPRGRPAASDAAQLELRLWAAGLGGAADGQAVSHHQPLFWSWHHDFWHRHRLPQQLW